MADVRQLTSRTLGLIDTVGAEKPWKEKAKTVRLILKDFYDSSDFLTGAVTGTIPGAIDHGGLGGLTDDDHPQYLLLTGRGGQTIVDNITITGTLDVTGVVSANGSAIIYSTASLPALALRDQTGSSQDVLQIQSDDGTAAYFRWNQNGQQMTWSNGTNDYLTLKAGATSHTFELIDGLSREMLYMHPGVNAAWADSSTSAIMGLFSSNPDGKRLIVQNFNGPFGRLGFSSARAVIDNTAGSVLAAPLSILDVVNRQTPGDIVSRIVPHSAQTADCWQVVDVAGTSTYLKVGVGVGVTQGIVEINSAQHGDYPLVINCNSAADATSSNTFTWLVIQDEAFNQLICTLSSVPAGGTLVFPPQGTVVTTSATQTLSNKTLNSINHLTSSTAASGVDFMDTTTNSKKLRPVLSGATGNNALVIISTAARTYTTLDYTGTIPLVGDDPPAVAAGALGKVDATAQGAAIGATNLTNGILAGHYLVVWTIETTTLDVTAGTIQFQVSYNDDVGATTQVGAALILTATGRDRGVFSVYAVAGTELSYQTNLVGIIATAKYAVRARVIALG